MKFFRSIVHLDADAFFASVEQAADPRLRGKPVAVGGEKRGVIAAASYEARRFGVHTPMPTVQARKLCPHLIVLPGDFEKYERFSRWMFSYAQDFTPDVEIGSIDEGYFDVTGARQPPVAIAATIRRAIQQALKISVSEGLGANKLVSQIASKLRKPAAFLEVPAGTETAFLAPLANHWLPGVGPQTARRLQAAGLARIGQIAATPFEFLALLLGNTARQTIEFANGIDPRPVRAAAAPAQSYRQQETFAADTTDEDFVEATLRRMADELMARVRADGYSIRTLAVTARYNDMAEDRRSASLAEPTDLETDLYPKLRPLLQQAWQRRVSLRLVALKLSGVYRGLRAAELPLGPAPQQYAVRQRLAQTIDALRETHGRYAIMRGHDLLLRKQDESGERKAESGERRAESGKPQALSRVEGRRAESEDHAPVGANCIRDRDGCGQSRLQIAPTDKGTYVPLHVHSYYSFLESTLSIAAIIELARRYELPAVALTDTGNLHGAVAFVQAAKAAGLKPIVGAELAGRLFFVENATGYRNLCRLLSQAGREPTPNPSGGGESGFGTEGLIVESAAAWPAIHYGAPADRGNYDIIQSIRTLTLLRQQHPDKRLAGDFHFPSPAEMTDASRRARSLEIAARCQFDFELGQLQFPAFTPPAGATPREFLRQLVLAGMQRRYPVRRSFGCSRAREGVAWGEDANRGATPLRARLPGQRPGEMALTPAGPPLAQIEEELAIIHEVGYEEYFLVVWDILQECRRRGIEWITRGSAADSLVCYCLGISDVCPIRFDLYFRRFLNKARMKLRKLPDIDVDFPHDRKDEVVDLIFAKYGRDHAAVVGGFSTYQGRSALADIGKVLGLSEYQVRRFTERLPHVAARDLAAAVAQSIECRDLPLAEDPYATALRLAEFLDGFPRYPKMHPCGVVLSRAPMLDLTPCFLSQKNYPTTQFDMDAVEAIGLVKIDILAQGGLAVMRDTRALLAARGIEVDLRTQGSSPWDDPRVWDMIARGGARAVHHIESPAMISLCRMCAVHEIDGLIAIVSVIRPGAANGAKKLAFTRRYQGREPVVYPHPSLAACLHSTFGMVVYEEHILQICEAFAGLPADRADVLRRALVKENWPVVEQIGREFAQSARQHGCTAAEIATVWKLVTDFHGYAFCKAHSAAYGLEAYQAAWLKCYYPAEFMAAVLSNGKGFYRPLVYVLECHRLGLPLLPPWINEPGPMFLVRAGQIRVPATRTKGLPARTGDRLIAERARGEFASLADFCRRVMPAREELEALSRVGALDGFGQSRPAQFWQIQQWAKGGSDAESLFARRSEFHSRPVAMTNRSDEIVPGVALTEPTRAERLQWETELLGFPVSGHPLELYPDIAWESYCPVAELGRHAGETVTCCGLIIEDRLHHQVTGEPMKFLTLADWTGLIETELFAPTYKTYGLATVRYPVLEITATVIPFENGNGHSLRVHRAGPPRRRRPPIP